jgi:hypothetical protein
MKANLHRWVPAGILAGLLLAGPALAQKPTVPPYDRDAPTGEPPPVPSTTEEGEVQARGPVHEAFAQPSEAVAKPTLVATKEPPPLIEEVPPDEKPSGDNVLWIPGYWSWDDDSSEYLWVSGCWRVAPVGRKWAPGYWNKVEGGYQWVAGFWADAKADELPYLETPPPASLERGPSTPAPDDNTFYVPGTWVQRESRYVWRPGYWSVARPGWVYIPPRYNWTPAGYVFISGYWDFPLEKRGILFAPVVFPRRLLARTGWGYVPRWTVAAPVLLRSLWVRPGAGYYAFGDYYAARYGRLGYHPWINWAGRFRDPLFNWYRAANRRNPGWERGLASLYRGRLAGTAALPPRTLAAQRVAMGARVLRPLSGFRSSAFRLTRVTSAQRAVALRGVSSFRGVSVSRFRSETRVGGVGRGAFLRNVPGVVGGRVARAGVAGGGVRRVATAGAGVRTTRSFAGYRTTTGFRVGATARSSVTRAATTARSTVSRGAAVRGTAARSFTARAATARSSTTRFARSTSSRTAVTHRSSTRGASVHSSARRSTTRVRHSTTIRRSGHR